MKPNPEYQNEKGRFDGRKAGPGRPRGIPNFEAAIKRVLSDNADEFADVLAKMLREGDSKAWDLAAKRAYPEPKQELDVTSDGGPVEFSWRKPDKRKRKRRKPEPTEPEPEPPVDSSS